MSEETDQPVATEQEASAVMEVPEPTEMVQEAPASQEQEVAAEEQPADIVQDSPKEEQRKSVKFDTDLTFDEAQAEINAIRARAGQARESLRTPSYSPTPAPYTPSTTISKTYSSSSSLDDDMPRSKNMLSHLNSNSAMLNYKVQSARTLVRKQEDLLRNLARMRENMERSENEIGKASDYYVRHTPRRYDYPVRHETSSSVRRQLREELPLASPPTIEVERKIDLMETAASASSISPPAPVLNDTKYVSSIHSATEYQPDEDFEREMEAIRKRVANIAKKANEVTAPRYNSSAYDYVYDTPSYLREYTDLYTLPDQHYEVTPSSLEDPNPYSYSAPSPYMQTSTYDDSSSLGVYPSNGYSDYVLESLNEYPTYAPTSSYDIYYDPYSSSGVDAYIAY